MNIGITTLCTHWLALGAAAILLVIALTAGTLFAANGRQQPEAQPRPQQSVADAADTDLAPDFRRPRPSRSASLPSKTTTTRKGLTCRRL